MKYLEQEMSTANSADLVIHTLDFALAACAAKEAGRVRKALALLEQSLNPHVFPDLAGSLLAVYRHCADLVDQGAFDEAARCLGILNEAWMRAKAGK